MSNKLREIEALGQAIWIDNLNRQLLDDGTLADLIEQDGISGVTSNPTIFEKGMGNSDRYDDAFREVAADTDDPQEIFERLALQDVRDAADLLRPTFESTRETKKLATEAARSTGSPASTRRPSART